MFILEEYIIIMSHTNLLILHDLTIRIAGFVHAVILLQHRTIFYNDLVCSKFEKRNHII